MKNGTTTLIPWLSTAKAPRIAVVGDVILDEYLEGQVNRISPEAPVPVHLVSKSFHCAGGAANAARNIKTAGGEPILVSVLGNDEAGRNLKEVLKKDQIDLSHLIAVTDRPTVRKTRVTSSNQQLVRIDWERVHPIDQDTQQRMLADLEKLEFDALLISDYGKGVLPISFLSNLMQLAKKRGIPAVVDPKGRDFSKYLHASLITPNRKEACDALNLDPAGDFSGEDLGRRLQRTFGLQNVLVTMGPKGMVLVPPAGTDEPAIDLPAIAREVYDVSGAGDTVVAVMALSMAAKVPMPEAMHLAQTAAAIVVAKWGTQPIFAQELEAALRQRPDPSQHLHSSQGKVTTKEALVQVIKDPTSRNKKVVFTNGCFDILHAGHITYLEDARSLGDLLVIGVNTDESVAELKGKTRPIIKLEHRMRLLAALGCVDYVVPFAEATPDDLVAFLIPDVLVKGADYDKDAKAGQAKHIAGSEVVKAHGGRVETIALVPGLSTSSILAKILGS